MEKNLIVREEDAPNYISPNEYDLFYIRVQLLAKQIAKVYEVTIQELGVLEDEFHAKKD